MTFPEDTAMNRRVYLHAITHLARDASAFEFRPVDGAPLAPFTAGAHIDLILPNGVRRSYSLCNSQEETHRYVVGVKKASPSRGASIYLHTSYASAPRSKSRCRATIFHWSRAPRTRC
jgi:ferredoxin-NADP reductase